MKMKQPPGQPTRCPYFSKTYGILLVLGLLCSVFHETSWADDEDISLRPKDQDLHFKLYTGKPPGEPVLPPGKPAPKTTYSRYQVYRNVHIPAIDIYQAKGKSRTRAAVIICAGGAYSGIVYGREGIKTAKWFRSQGITAVVLRYRLKPYRHPVPMSDVQRAIQVVRAKADELDIDPQRIGVMGFSAGGHAVSMATVNHLEPDPKSEDPYARVSSRPDFSVLVYPVISMHPPLTHLGSQKNLLGSSPSKERMDEASSFMHVSPQTPPTLLVHSKDDNDVPIGNSEAFLEALKKHGVPGKLLTYETGGHGYGIGRKKTDPNAKWPTECMEWLRLMKVIDLDESP